MPRSGQAWDAEFASRSPHFDVYAELLSAWQGRDSWPSVADFTQLSERQRQLRAGDQPSLDFVTVRPRPRRARRDVVVLEELYDARIAGNRSVPCLERSYHDLFNALIFAAFPRAKRALHARQFRALGERVVPGVHRLPSARTREQDALTIFDEGGSLLVTTAEWLERWKGSPVRHEVSLQAGLRLVVFGHAVLEHLHAEGHGLRSIIRSSARFVVAKDMEGPAQLLDALDVRLHAWLVDPLDFLTPDSGAVVTFEVDGSVWVEPSRSAALAAARMDKPPEASSIPRS